MALGILVNAPSDPDQGDSWAKVVDDYVVEVSSYSVNDITPMQSDADYWVDFTGTADPVTAVPVNPLVGDVYFSDTNTFQHHWGDVYNAPEDTAASHLWIGLDKNNVVISIYTYSLDYIQGNPEVQYSADLWVDLTELEISTASLYLVFDENTNTLVIPPTTGISALEDAMAALQTALLAVAAQINSMEYVYNINLGVSNGTNTAEETFTPNEGPMWDTIVNWATSGSL